MYTLTLHETNPENPSSNHEETETFPFKMIDLMSAATVAIGVANISEATGTLEDIDVVEADDSRDRVKTVSVEDVGNKSKVAMEIELNKVEQIESSNATNIDVSPLDGYE